MTNASAVREAGPAQAVSPRGRFFANQTFHYETLRNAGYITSGAWPEPVAECHSIDKKGEEPCHS